MSNRDINATPPSFSQKNRGTTSGKIKREVQKVYFLHFFFIKCLQIQK